MKFALFALITASLTTFAQEPVGLTFQSWKDQQVLEAQNQLLRASNRLAQAKTGRSPAPLQTASTKPINDKVKKTQDDPVTAAERDVKRAQDTLERAKELDFAQYIEIYLPTLEGQPEVLQKLSDQFSKDELAQIVKTLMRRSGPADAKHKAAMLEGLYGSSATKAQ